MVGNVGFGGDDVMGEKGGEVGECVKDWGDMGGVISVNVWVGVLCGVD